jgi:probable phosphoglycerate mutase
MRLILVRHGSTTFNEDGLVLGRSDPPLSAVGLEQAQAVAHALAGKPVQAVYTSPLKRAQQTAAAIATALGLTPVLEQGLLELDAGELEGLKFEEMRQHHAGFLAQWTRDPGPLMMPGGESLDVVQARAWEAVHEIRERHPKGTVIAVTHNFVILVILCQALGIRLARFRGLRHEVGATSTLELAGDRAVLVSLNDRCHLEHGAGG